MTNFIRRHRKASVFGAVVGLVLAGGVAWAIYLLSLGVTGNVSVGQAAWQYISNGTATADCTGGTGTWTQPPSGPSTVTATGLFPGDSCTYAPVVQTKATGNTVDLKVTEVDVTLPTGWTLDATGACGTTIPKAATAGNPGIATPVPFKLTAGDNAVAGAITGTINAVPASQFDASMCN